MSRRDHGRRAGAWDPGDDVRGGERRGGAPVRVLSAAGRVLRETLLTLAALGGAVCIVLVIIAYVGGYSLIMFKTGSMSPTIPAGSVALVRETPASEVEVGDVLTVDRPGQLPVTHRVTSVAPGADGDGGASGAERTITMRGDANEEDDPAPYSVERGRVVVGSVPHLAHAIVWFGNPWVLGGITLAAASLVTWAFWPRDPGRPGAAPTSRIRPRHGAADSDGPPAPEDEGPEEPAAAQPGAHRALAPVLIGALSLAGLVLGPSASEAQAADPLILRSDLPAGVHLLDASAPLMWHVDVDAGAAPRGGDLRVAIAGSGSASVGLAAEIRACDEPWTATGCPRGELLLRPEAVVAVGSGWDELLRADTPAATYLRLSVTAQPTAGEDAGEKARLTVRAVAAEWQDETSIDGGSGSGAASDEGGLAATGASTLALLAAPAAVLLGLAGALLARRRVVEGRSRAGLR